ncbi:MAG TPA: DUF6588 family protein [Bacteroidales bacterium]|nr:DUF6588 family protein [Bacteroidales bacterium]
MTRRFFKTTGLILTGLLLFSSMTIAQINNFDFLRTSTGDATKLLTAYMTPWTKAFGAGLNGGWYNTAKPHKLLGFDLTLSVNAGIVPESEGTYNISALNLASVNGSGTAPTVSGATQPGPQLQFMDPTKTYSLATFNAPEGTGFRYIPVPTLQLGLGLPLGSEVKVRYIPTITIKDGDIGLWGVGLMHNLTQYLPGDKLLPFDVSLFGGYTKLEGNVPVNIQPQTGIPQSFSPAVSWDNQKMNVTVTAITVSAIASLNLPVVTFYGGLGYSKTNTALKLDGNFPTPVFVTTPTPGPVYNNSGVKSGASFGEISANDFSGLRANIGLRLKLAILTIHADYTRAQYNVLSTGLGFSFR